MQSFYVRRCEFDPDTLLIYFEYVYVGEITLEHTGERYIVRPSWGDENFTAATIEEATVDLIFEYCRYYSRTALDC